MTFMTFDQFLWHLMTKILNFKFLWHFMVLWWCGSPATLMLKLEARLSSNNMYFPGFCFTFSMKILKNQISKVAESNHSDFVVINSTLQSITLHTALIQIFSLVYYHWQKTFSFSTTAPHHQNSCFTSIFYIFHSLSSPPYKYPALNRIILQIRFVIIENICSRYIS